jgi:hypothetical protein
VLLTRLFTYIFNRWNCLPGTEYLVSDPVDVQGLDDLIESCCGQPVPEVVFETIKPPKNGTDPFAELSPELLQMVLYHLECRDVANLRLASPSFVQLPQTFFRQIIRKAMPWVWEMDNFQPLKQVDWYKLWCKLAKADGGTFPDVKEREFVRSQWRVIENGAMEILKREGITTADPEAWNSRLVTAREELEKDATVKLNTDFNFRGRSRPMETEIRGLRNRRRIYGDIEEILTRMQWVDRVWCSS